MRSVVFANNGKALAVGVVLGIGALVGWRYWSTHQDSSSREVSAHYQQLTTALDASKPQTLEAVAKFANENSNTYGALASLDLAKQYVDKTSWRKRPDSCKAALKYARRQPAGGNESARRGFSCNRSRRTTR